MRNKEKDNAREIAEMRINDLFEQAKIEYKNKPELANRYVKLAWKLKLKYNVKLSKKIKRLFCKKCLSYWVPGKSVKIRNKKGIQIFHCLNCKNIKRFKYK